MSLDPPLRPDTPCGPDTASVAFPQVPGYKVLRELGRGGMGVVYEARQEGLNRTVALKMILKGEHASAEDLARFRAEALAIARLPHPNIVQVYAVGTHDGLPFFALEHCPGGTLAQRFASTGHMSPDAAAGLVADIARAVDAAHRAGIIHRDLKPGNVLLMTDHTPKVTDFGLAKQLDSPLDRTQSGAIIGTPGYMSPEQATGRVRDVGPPTDVYALGAVL
jgi:serine/threonine protein kinase